jgi:hypothetical protein
MQDDSALGKNFHLHNPTRFDLGQLLAWMRSFGYPVRPVTYEAFRETLLEAAACPGREAVAQMLTFFPAQIAEWRINVKADDARARAVLGAAGIACPQIDEALFHTYLRYFADCGFLPPPQRTRASTSRTLTAVS